MKISLGKIKDSLKDSIDVFICSSSYEERCFAIAKAVADFQISNKIIFFVKDLDTRIILNSDKLMSILGVDSKKYELLINNPASSLSSMNSAFTSVFSHTKPQRYMLDITTFTHEGLLMLFKLLQLRLKENDTLILSYNGAREYSFNELIPDKKWLSKGVNSIRSILGYPGLLDPSRKNHLIVLFGFESERTRRLIEMFEYDLVTLAFGGEKISINDVHQRLNESRHDELLLLYTDAKKLEISLIDASMTKKQLLAYINKFPNYNTVIAPMNTKISSIGAALAAIENPEIQLCYVTANQYNIEGYSHPSDDCYLLEVKF